jgi:nitrogen fixation-related uncharacterized protein
MEALTLQVFVSLALVAGSLLLFLFTCRQRDFDHADRLALLPLDDDDGTPGAQPPRRRHPKDDDHE